MYISETKIRVRYAETDQMGYVYYGNYAQYFEVGRVEAMRQLGMSYHEMEESGVMLPVISYSVKFLKPAFYDNVLTIRTIIKEIPTTRLMFEYECVNENGDTLCKGETILVFIKKDSGRPRSAPEDFIKLLKSKMNFDNC